MNITNAILAGFVSSVVSEVFKFIPFIRDNTIARAVTIIVVTLVASFVAEGKFNLEGFVAAAVVALTSYRTIVQPIATATGSATQA